MSASLIKCLRTAGVIAVLFMLLLTMAEPLMADDSATHWRKRHLQRHHRWQKWKKDNCGPTHGDNNNSVPEISLGEAGAAGVLIVGSVLILTDRLRRRRFALKSQ